MGKIKEIYKYSYNDVSVIPAKITDIKHRSECNPFKNGFLPIFAAPMTSVVNEENFLFYEDNHIIPILPRNYSLETRIDYSLQNRWAAYSLSEFTDVWCNEEKKILFDSEAQANVLIDVANGHMKSLYDASKKAKDIYGDNLILMVGNIANPETYEIAAKSGVDYVRCGIGGGEGCITSTNTSINYPQASLISDMVEIKEHLKMGNPYMKLPKIVADGGIRNFCDVIKALSIGADYVMIGGIFGKLLESASPCIMFTENGTQEVSGLSLKVSGGFEYNGNGNFTLDGKPLRMMKKFYGMASKLGQKDIGSEEKVEEGIVKMFPLQGTIDEWVEKMIHYLMSAMSYVNCNDVSNLSECADVMLVTTNAYECINR